MKKVWDYLNGKKTIIGFIFGLLTGAMYIANGVKPVIPIDIVHGSELIAASFGIVGGGHKLTKSKVGKNILNNIANAGKKLIKK